MSFSLYFGRGRGVEGIWIDENKIESKLRKQDQFLEYIRKFLTSSTLIDIKLHDLDRILVIEYFKYGRENKFQLFYKARELYFSNTYYDLKKESFVTYKSWSNRKDNNTEEIFEELGLKELDQNKVNDFKDVGVILESENKELKKSKNKKLKKLEKKIINIKKDLEKMISYSKLYDFADSYEDLSKLGKKEIIYGIKFNFESTNHFQRRNLIFTKAKKLKNKIEFMRNRLINTENELKNIKDKEVWINNLQTVKPIIKKVIKKIEEKQTSEYQLFTIDEYKLGIGTSASGNDSLRSEWAKKSDVWFHLEDETSPHIIAKIDLKDVANIIDSVAKKFSEVMSGEKSELNIIYTQVKNLKGIKGKKGSVNYKKVKHYRAII